MVFVLNKSIIKNPALAEKGRLKIEWARSFMPVMELIRTKQLCKTKLKGVRIASILHLEAKTAVFLQTLADSGTEIFATSCNPETTQDDVAAALAEHPQITVYAWRGESESDYWKNIRRVLLSKPDIIIDDGADGIIYAHEKLSGVISQLIGATEETTTGITRIKALSEHGMLRIPVIGVNEGKMKFLFDNRYGTGESSVFGLLNATNLTIAGKNAVVVGFGWVGKGIAKRLRGMGARVIICEVDPVKAVEAYMEGYRIMRLIDAVKVADFVITATGVNKVVRKEHILEAKNRCIFANSGHFNVEIDLEDLNEVTTSKKKTRYFGLPYNDFLVEEYRLINGKVVYLLGKGRLVNLVCGQGHATEIMDLSFSLQFLSILYLIDHKDDLEPMLYSVPGDIDDMVARLKLESLGIQIDSLSAEQRAYIKRFK